MIKQLVDEGWTAWMYVKGEPPAWLGVMGAFAIDNDQQLFGWRATGEDVTHVHIWTSKENIDPRMFVFGCADGTVYIFSRDLTPYQRDLLDEWNAHASEHSDDAAVIGPAYMQRKFASDYNPPQEPQ